MVGEVSWDGNVCYNVRRGYDRVEGSIDRSYDEIRGVTMSVNRNFHMLGEITTGKMVAKFDCLSIAEVVSVDVIVASNDEFQRGGGCVGKNDENWLRRLKKG